MAIELEHTIFQNSDFETTDSDHSLPHVQSSSITSQRFVENMSTPDSRSNITELAAWADSQGILLIPGIPECLTEDARGNLNLQPNVQEIPQPGGANFLNGIAIDRVLSGELLCSSDPMQKKHIERVKELARETYGRFLNAEVDSSGQMKEVHIDPSLTRRPSRY